MRADAGSVTVGGLQVEVTRKAMKNLRLRVLPEGRICVSAPWLTSQRQIAAFVERNRDWIEAQLKKQESRPVPAAREYITGESLSLWGREYPLRLEPCGRGGGVELIDGEAVLRVPEGSDAEKRESVVFQWYREELARAAAMRLPLWEQAAGLYCGSWQIKRMKTRWGSCNTRAKRIWLSLYLARTPDACLDYVILHELAHLRYADHGAGFKAFLDGLMPDWRERRKLLRAYEAEMK